jgi:RHS repeat-associated protein
MLWAHELAARTQYKDGTPNYFYYDAMLRRYAIEESTGLSYFTWDQNGMNLLTERDTAGSVTAEYGHGYTPIDGIGSMAAARKDVSGATYYQYPVYDHRGTVMRLVDGTGTVTASYEYDAWGTQLEDSDTAVENRFRYQSDWIEPKDSDGKLYLSFRRLYDIASGRFLQRDPVGDRGGRSAYEFAGGSPTIAVDPLGLQTHVDHPALLKADPFQQAAMLRAYEAQGLHVPSLYLKKSEEELREMLRPDPGRAVRPDSLGVKISRMFASRIALMGLSAITNRFRADEYALADDHGEMAVAARADMKGFYDRFVKRISSQLTEKYQRVTIPRENAAANNNLFIIDSPKILSFWLTASANVYVQGVMEAKCVGGKLYYRRVRADWEWHDDIDAQSFYGVHWIKGESHYVGRGFWERVEGVWDIVGDSLLDTDFRVRISYTDHVPQEQEGDLDANSP